MDERQKKLVRCYGKRTFDRCSRMMDDCLHLPTDALSVLTDEEWKKCAETMVAFQEELHEVRKLVYKRMKEAGVEL